LKARLRATSQIIDVVRTLFEFVSVYKRFFISIVLLIVSFVLVMYYIGEVTVQNREYEVRVKEGDTERLLVP
jgi:hypothetical protein